MGVPASMLPHTVTVVHPAVSSDAYNNVTYDYGAAATRAAAPAWLQQDQRTEPHPDGRDPLDQFWLMVTNYDGIAGVDRIEWADHPAGPVVFTVDGPPEPAYTPAGYHHSELTLRVTEG